MRQSTKFLLLFAVLTLSLSTLWAVITTSGYSIQDVSSSMPIQNGTDGPRGAWALALDGSRILATDVADGHVYEVGAGTASVVGGGAAPVVAGLAGLVRTRDGRLFGGLLDAGSWWSSAL